MKLEVDLVYLYCNDNDLHWHQKRMDWAKRLGASNSSENHVCRFADNGELRFSLRSVEKYIPWINNIFIITDGQIPEWLDLNNPKIKIVNHSDIIPSKYLPLFNSSAIEYYLDKIPDLSENFIYMNDDIFFNKPMSVENFFDKNGNPIINLRIYDTDDDSDKEIGMYIKNVLYSTDIFNSRFPLPEELRRIDLTHGVDAYKKSYFSECKEIFSDETERLSLCKFRKENTVTRLLFSLYNVICKKCSYKLIAPIKEQYLSKDLDTIYFDLKKVKELPSMLEKYAPKIFCVNDYEYAKKNDRLELKSIMSEIFTDTASWEKPENFVINPVWENEDFYTVVFAINDEFCKYFSVALQSLISNSKPNEKYDIIILSTYISETNRDLLYSMLPENFSLRIYYVLDHLKTTFPEFQFRSLNSWSVEMYFRMFIPFIMPSYKKILYLDSDLVINSSLKDLFSAPDNGFPISAVVDASSKIWFLDFFKKRTEYMQNILKMKDLSNYFNSGVLMFNMDNINLSEYSKLLGKWNDTSDLMYPDQDILNAVFENNTNFLHYRWNTCTGSIICIENFENLCDSEEYLREYLEGIDNPSIVHYTGIKPWTSNLYIFFNLFWKYARKTPFYEDILYAMIQKSVIKASSKNAAYTNFSALLKSQLTKRIVLWGASLFLEDYLKNYEILNNNIVGIIDKSGYKKGLYLNKYEIFAPEDIEKLNPDVIIITIDKQQKKRFEEIRQYLDEHCKKNFDVQIV